MTRNLKKIRLILAIVFFLLLIVSFSDVKGAIPASWHRAFSYLQFIPSLLSFFSKTSVISIGFLVVLLLTFLGGRVYCSAICPIGIFQDIILCFKYMFKGKNKPRYKRPLNLIRYGILILTVLSLFFGGILLLNLLDPFANFGRMASHLYQPVFIKVNNFVSGIGFSEIKMTSAQPVHLASFLFAIGIFGLLIVFTLFGNRIYCNTICPVGALLGLVSRMSIFKIRLNDLQCTQCGKCASECKSDCIDVKNMSVDVTRCVGCYNCLSVCDVDAVLYTSKAATKKDYIPQESNIGRRLFLATTASYAFSRVLKAEWGPGNGKGYQHQHGRGEGNRVHYSDRGPIAPPGALSISNFKKHCVACHLCIATCPTKVLQPSFLEYGFTGMNLPKMDYGISYCNYDCRQCGKICPTGALTILPKEEKQRTQIGRAVLRLHKCVVESEGTACGSCSEHCPTQAVHMVPNASGIPSPQLNVDICIGCGACEYACPVTDPHPAIFVVPNEVHVVVDKLEQGKVDYKESDEFPF